MKKALSCVIVFVALTIPTMSADADPFGHRYFKDKGIFPHGHSHSYGFGYNPYTPRGLDSSVYAPLMMMLLLPHVLKSPSARPHKRHYRHHKHHRNHRHHRRHRDRGRHR